MGRALGMASDGPGSTLNGGWCRLGGWRFILLFFMVVGVLLVTGWGARGLAWALLNVGTVELNRATISEDPLTRSERAQVLDRAQWLLRTAAGLDERNAAVQRNLALTLAAQDDARRARAAADRARALTPASDQPGQFQLGRAYVAINVWGEAVRAWQAAGASAQLNQLGSMLIRRRNWDQAIAAFTASAVLEPTSRGAYEGIVRVGRERDDDLDARIAYFEPLIARGGMNEYLSRIKISTIYRESGRPFDALASLDAAGRVGEDNDLLLERGIVLAQLGHWSEAMVALDRPTNDRTVEEEALYWLAVARVGAGAYDAAMSAAQRGIERLESGRAARRAPFLAIIGDLLLVRGRPAEALANYQEGLALAPNDPHLLDGAARAQTAAAGGPINLLFNPSFEWQGLWVLTPAGPANGSDLQSKERPASGVTAARIAADSGGSRTAVQIVRQLRPGATYRLTARARTDGRPATLRVRPAAGDGPATTLARAQTASADWTTLTVELQAPASDVLVEVGLPESAPGAAAAWFDDLTLIVIQDRR